VSSTAALEALPPLRAVIAAHGLSARKALGQNFLLDLNLTRRIARAGGPLAGTHVVEVGPGPGGLTRALLLEGAERVTAIERDPRALPALAEIAMAAPGRFTIVEADALSFSYESLAGELPLRIVANLPYNIATPLLTGWLSTEPWPPWWQSLTLMFQREVAERIVAKPGGKDYGRLAVLAQWRSRPKLLFEVPARAFTPPPKVTSAVVRIEPRPDAEPLPVAAVEAVTAAAFGQRRKMLRSSLRSLWPQPEAMLEQAGIDPTLRAEQVEVPGFLRLAALVAGAAGPTAETIRPA
jgi:16S rRNA (adenine1518-N6/adenine1519-N6)-dimethyltransferase